MIHSPFAKQCRAELLSLLSQEHTNPGEQDFPGCCLGVFVCFPLLKCCLRAFSFFLFNFTFALKLQASMCCSVLNACAISTSRCLKIRFEAKLCPCRLFPGKLRWGVGVETTQPLYSNTVNVLLILKQELGRDRAGKAEHCC